MSLGVLQGFTSFFLLLLEIFSKPVLYTTSSYLEYMSCYLYYLIFLSATAAWSQSARFNKQYSYVYGASRMVIRISGAIKIQIWKVLIISIYV